MRASIIVPTHNRRDDLAELLPELSRQAAVWGDTEIIVVDDASSDGTAAWLAATFPAIRLIRNEASAGPAASRNRGARVAAGGLLLFLDSDGVPEPDWLKAMLHAADGLTVLLGCPVDYATGRVQGTPRRATFLGKSLRCAPEAANTGPSCNFAFPRRVFLAVGGFDESIPYYFEDSDLCIRARMAGARFRYVPEAVFRHKGTETKRGDAIRMQEENSSFAMLRLYRTRKPLLAAFVLCNALWMTARVALCRAPALPGERPREQVGGGGMPRGAGLTRMPKGFSMHRRGPRVWMPAFASTTVPAGCVWNPRPTQAAPRGTRPQSAEHLRRSALLAGKRAVPGRG